MKIEIEERETGGAFVYSSSEDHKARMTFSKAGADMIIIDHTEVDAELRGQGVGEELAEYMVKYARTKNLKVLPLCPFTRSVFEKNPQLRDVLKS